MERRINPAVIRTLRQAKHWTQEELAQASGLSLRTIQRVEDDGTVSASTIKSLAAVFEVDSLELHAQSATRRSIWGAHAGVAFGMAGTAIGWLAAMMSIRSALIANETTGLEAGTTAAIISTFAGLTCALLGMVHNRYMRRLRS